MIQIPAGGQIDFQVEAKIGYVHRIIQGAFAPYYFNGTESEWSNIQTVSIPVSSTSESPTPTVPEFPVIILLPVLLSLFSVAVLFKHRKTRNQTSYCSSFGTAKNKSFQH